MCKNIKLFISSTLLIALFSTCKTDSPSTSRSIQNNKEQVAFSKISGRTMGTTYNVIYQSEINYKSKIDSLLVDINNGVSTYIPTSTISVVNNDSLGLRSQNTVTYNIKPNTHFENNFLASKDVFLKSDKYFDPTIMPLVNYWGFGYKTKRPIEEADTQKVNALKVKVDFDKWTAQIIDSILQVQKPIGAELDFSGIAKGYGVDMVASFLDDLNIENYFVEIGGEVMVKGQNDRGTPWTIGLSKPEVNAGFRDFQTLVSLSNVGMASSGNYRNYYEVNGQTYGHEINPKTGFPEISKLLGTSVIASNCKLADAYATAFMVMGLDKSVVLIEELNNTEACFFIRSENGEIETINSSGFGSYLK